MGAEMPEPTRRPSRRRPTVKFGRLLFLAFLGLVLVVGVRREVIDLFAVREYSMWPTLVGGEDRVWVYKLTSHPRRFEAWVAIDPEAPAGRERFVKRVLGLPGEFVDFVRGDVWVGSDRQRLQRAFRPPELLQSMWIPILHGDEAVDPGRFRVEGGILQPERGRSFSLRAEVPTCVAALKGGRRYTSEEIVDDFRTETGWVAGTRAVADVQVGLFIRDVTLGATFRVRHELGHQTYRDLEFRAGTLRVLDGSPREAPRILAERGGIALPVWVQMTTLDGSFEVKVGSSPAQAARIYEGERRTEEFGSYSRVTLGLDRGAAELAALDVRRDVFYGWPREREQGGPEFVPPGHVFLVGDNAPASDDGRARGATPVARLIGRMVGRWSSRPPSSPE